MSNIPTLMPILTKTRRHGSDAVDDEVPMSGRDKGARIDLGLAILSAIAVPGVRYDRKEIAAWCGCTDSTIYNIEVTALKKIRQRFPELCEELQATIPLHAA